MKPTGNPNHPVTKFMEEQWQKIVALLVLKTGDRAVITLEEIRRMVDRPGGANVTVRISDETGIELRIVDDAEAERLAREEGGLPA
jgi:hypothetical protein